MHRQTALDGICESPLNFYPVEAENNDLYTLLRLLNSFHQSGDSGAWLYQQFHWRSDRVLWAAAMPMESFRPLTMAVQQANSRGSSCSSRRYGILTSDFRYA